ncbi:MAG: murein biosynthesis integral membrane protein MurJ [Alphaproteobacteria bacterium]|nr:murein biosynthesis integral membrane protein MurJ [Alphaproteobacteria bacterium]
MPPGADHDLRRDALRVGAANLLSRVTGLLREIAFAAAFGAGMAADAYNAAFRIGNLLRELFAEGALSNAFIPLFAKVDEAEGQESAFRLANAFLGVLLAALGALTLATLLLAEPLVMLVAGGFAEVEGKVALTATLTRILAPFVATISVASVFMGVLNVRGRFFLPAVSPVVFNGLIIAACLGAAPFAQATGWPAIYAVALAALVGGAAQAAIQLPPLWRGGFRLRPTLGAHPALRRLLAFLGPAVVAISVVQINLLIETQLASREGDGPVSWLLYAFRVAHLPFSIVSGALGVASLAGLSVLVARGDDAGFRRTLAGALNLNTFWLLPSAVGMALLAEPLVALLFERGAFTAQDTAQTALLLQAYAVAVLAIGAQRILVPVFYTLDDPRTPMWIGLGTVALKLPVALGLMAWVGLAGIPLSHAVLAGAEVVVLVGLLERRVGGVVRQMIGLHARAAVAAAVMGAAVWAAAARLPMDRGLLLVAGLSALGAAVYLGACELLGLREGRAMVGRLLRRRPRGLPPTVDPETRRLLEGLAAGPLPRPRLVNGEAWLAGVCLRAVDGCVVAAEISGEDPDGEAIPGGLRAVMRVGAGPPQLAGLTYVDPEGRARWSLRAEGEVLVAGEASGPVLPIVAS